MTKIRPFKFWVQSVLPLVYDDSLSYYELLCKVVNYINGLIENNNQLIKGFEEVVQKFDELKEWVENYFDTEDFKQDIEDALDEMVEAGTFDDIIRPVLDELVEDLTDRMDALEDAVDELEVSENHIFNSIDAMQEAGAGIGKDLWLAGDSVFGDRQDTLFRVSDTDDGMGIELDSGLFANPNTRGLYVSKMTGDSNYEKLQTAITNAIASKSESVIIDCYCDITGHTLDMTKGLYYTSEEQVRFRRPLTLICIGDGAIYKGDNGYMFSATEFSGDYVFINLKITGNVDLSVPDGSAAKKVGCSVFDVHRLIRIKTYGCSYTLVGVVFDGIDASSFTTENAQSIVSYGDTLTYSNCFYRLKACWDITMDGCLIENCNYAIYSEYASTTLNHIKILNCCIESSAYPPLYFDTETIMQNLTIQGNYFENNTDCDIKITTGVGGFLMIGNRFAIINANHHCLEYVVRGASATSIGNNVTGTAASSSILIYITNVVNDDLVMFSINDVFTGALTNDEFHVLRNLRATIAALASTSISDVNSPLANKQNFYMQVPAGANISNLPSSLAMAFLSLGDNTSRIQFAVASNGTVYIRSRIGGVGYTAWKSIS